ncbi:MAG: Holliday junction resolvase RuvX, partial [Clostridia bacterium]|nr:Holliday junction resolvase RuvX [Clostridia bacterium]
TAEEALRLIGKLRAEIAVVGLPLNMDGSEGKRAETARAFGAMLASLSEGTIPVVFCDERLSTVEAHGILSEVDVRRKKRKKVVDTLAAELILQSYLDEERKKKANSSL